MINMTIKMKSREISLLYFNCTMQGGAPSPLYVNYIPGIINMIFLFLF